MAPKQQLHAITQNQQNSDSTASLVSKSALYNIYSEGDIDIINEMDNTELYTNLDEDIQRQSTSYSRTETYNHHKTSKVFKILQQFASLLILGLLGNAYFILLELIDADDKTRKLPNLQDFKILYIFSDYLSENTDLKLQQARFINNAIFGILLGSIDSFLFDAWFQSVISRPKRSSYESTTVIRSLVAILGIAYGLKKLDWETPLQASLAWSLLNPCLWISLDGTLYGFVVDSLISILFVTVSYYYDPATFVSSAIGFDWNKALFIGSASFVGLLVFGKVGRFLFE